MPGRPQSASPGYQSSCRWHGCASFLDSRLGCCHRLYRKVTHHFLAIYLACGRHRGDSSALGLPSCELSRSRQRSKEVQLAYSSEACGSRRCLQHESASLSSKRFLHGYCCSEIGVACAGVRHRASTQLSEARPCHCLQKTSLSFWASSR